MSSAAAAATAAPASTPKKGRKKIFLIAAAVALLLVMGGIAAFIALKPAPVDDEDDEVEVSATHATHKPKRAAAPEPFDPKHAPTFVQLEAFTVNLVDRDADRYAQIAITLEVEDGKASEQIKAFMPAIRNNILLVLASKGSDDMRTEEGKRLLAAQLRAQALRPLGYELTAQELLEIEASLQPGAPQRKKPKLPPLPIKAVHFSNFIVQ